MNEVQLLAFPSEISYTLGTKGAVSDTLASGKTYYTFVTDRGRSGTDVPGFRRKIANIENATSSFSAHTARVKREAWQFRIEWIAPVGSRNLETANGTSAITGTWTDPATLSITVADNAAKRKVLQDVMDRRSAFQGGVFLAEIDDTIRGIRHPLKALRDGLTSYHSKAKKLKSKLRGAGLQSAISGTWLEYQFGWLQNARDVESALANLQRMSKPRGLHFKANGVDITETSLTPTMTNPTPGFSSYIKQSMRRKTTVIVVYRGAYKVKPPSGWDFESWSLSTQDFVPSVWEAIPYSFVVDYFTNIGQIIQAYSYIPADIAWVAQTIRKEVKYRQFGTELYVFPRAYPVKSASVGSLGSTELVLTSVQRSTVSVANLVQRLQFRVPGAGSMSWLNLSALIRLKTL